jgi:membrane-bound lytic murein transglycosylase D
MNIPWTLVAILAASATGMGSKEHTLTNRTASESFEKGDFLSVSDEVVKERLSKMSLPVEVRSNSAVLTRIRQYLVNGRSETELILGRAPQYFPVFEYYLQQYNLPEELKYLPIIESGMIAKMKSHAGATGLWQLMPVSARYFGLSVNGTLDERLDVYRSSEAAAQMLKYLHDELGDWALVLAAYNSGIGKVKQAIHLAGTKNYWKVDDFLPAETRRYVPAFIAAAYISQYHLEHGIQPAASFQGSQNLRALRVTRQLSFGEISRVTGIKTATLAALNPAYVAGIVPKTSMGRYLVLPGSATNHLRNYLENNKPTPSDLIKTTYVVSKGDNLAKIAGLFQTSTDNLIIWNNLLDKKIVINQELVLFLPKSFFIDRV